jgi:beta-glucanase (GH16 family)
MGLPWNCALYIDIPGDNPMEIAVALRSGQVSFSLQGNTQDTKHHTFDSTDGYHVYRINYRDSVGTLYIDGSQVLQITEAESYAAGGTTGQTDFGNYQGGGARTGTDDSDWDYAYYFTSIFPRFSASGRSAASGRAAV